MKPQPQPKHIVCSECGLAWESHKATDAKKGVELTECIRLLKAELARRPSWTNTGHGVIHMGNIGSAS